MPPPPAMPSTRYPASCEPGSSDATEPLYTGGVPERANRLRHADAVVEAGQQLLGLAAAAQRPQSLLAVLGDEGRQGREPAHPRARSLEVDPLAVRIQGGHELVYAARRR